MTGDRRDVAVARIALARNRFAVVVACNERAAVATYTCCGVGALPRIAPSTPRSLTIPTLAKVSKIGEMWVNLARDSYKPVARAVAKKVA